MSTPGSASVKLAAAALVIALILVPVTIYVAVKVSQTASSIEQVKRRVEELGRNQTRSAQSIQDLSKRIESLEQRIAGIEQSVSSLNKTSSGLKGNLTSIASQLATLQAEIDSLRQGLAATNQSLQESLQSLSEEVNELYKRLQALEANASLLFPATIVDATGDEVVIESRPTRIVALAPSVVETLYFVNATDRLVGAPSQADWPPSVAEGLKNGTITDIGGYWTPSIEKILSLHPDLVIGVNGTPSHLQVKEQLKAYGIPTILVPQSSLEDIKTSIIMIGRATGNIAEAARAAATYEERLLSLRVAAERVNQTLSVAIVVWLGPPTWIAGNDTFQGSGIEAIGARNAFGYLRGWQAVSPEEFLHAKPDVIILGGINASDFLALLNETLGANASQIPAVANNRIYTFTGDLLNMLNRPSPRVVYALLAMQYVVYPELYNTTVDQLPHVLSEPPSVGFPSP